MYQRKCWVKNNKDENSILENLWNNGNIPPLNLILTMVSCFIILYFYFLFYLLDTEDFILMKDISFITKKNYLTTKVLKICENTLEVKCMTKITFFTFCPLTHFQ